MSELKKAGEEFDRKLSDLITTQYPAITPNAKEHVLYEKLLELEKEFEKIKDKLVRTTGKSA